MNPSLEKSLHQFDRFGGELYEQLRTRSEAELNRKPDATTWSAAEVLQHLMRVHDQYRARLEPLLDPAHRPGLAARLGLGAGFFAKILRGVTHPKAARKTRTLRIFEPTHSQFSKAIVPEFRQHTQQFADLLRRLPETRYGERISSPAGTWVVLPVEDVVHLLGNHLERHHRQIQSLLAT